MSHRGHSLQALPNSHHQHPHVEETGYQIATGWLQTGYRLDISWIWVRYRLAIGWLLAMGWLSAIYRLFTDGPGGRSMSCISAHLVLIQFQLYVLKYYIVFRVRNTLKFSLAHRASRLEKSLVCYQNHQPVIFLYFGGFPNI